MISLFGNNNRDTGGLIASLNEGNYSAYLIIFSAVGTSVSLLTVLSLSFSYGKLASKPPSTLVQTTNGALTVTEQDHLHRAPATIQKFTGQTLSTLLNWSGKTINDYGLIENDPGVNVGGQNKITTMAHEATNAFTTDKGLRSQVTQLMSKWTDSAYFEGKKQQHLEIKKIMIPQALDKKGRWRVNVVATRLIKQGELVEPITFNRSVFIRAVPIIENPSPETATAEQKAFYKVRKFGLEIYGMEKFDRQKI